MIVRAARDLGLLVREARRARRWTQVTLAQRAGVSREWVVALEKGGGGAEMGRVLRTLHVLGLAVDIAEPQPPSAEVRRSAAELEAVLAHSRSPSR
jgi:HTH-type transcriptional regulator/antitoxin HipB